MADIEADTWRSWLARLSNRSDKEGEKGGARPSPRGLILLVLIGIVLMLIGERLGGDRSVPSDAPPAGASVAPVIAAPAGSVERLERSLAAAVSQIVGVGNAEVLIVPKSSEVQVFAEEVTRRTSSTRTSGQGGGGGSETIEESVTRRPVIYRGEDGRTERPLVSHTEEPPIAGVLVTAVGAEDPRVRLLLLEAVSTLLDLPPHRVHIAAKTR